MHKFHIIAALTQCAVALANPVARATTAQPDASLWTSVQLNGQTFVNKGLVGFGLIPSNATDSTGDTLGGLGSAIGIKRGSFAAQSDGTYKGTLIVQPDRGYNVEGTVNYQGRQHQIDFVLNPYYSTSKLTFAAAQQTLKLQYKSTLLYTERSGATTSGLDALGYRAAGNGYPSVLSADPVLPIPNSTYNHLSLDLEGLYLNADGTFWVSDEYGPYIYQFSSNGSLIQAIQPPDAIVPLVKGKVDFTSDDDPDTGRAGNNGFECLTVDESTNTLWAMLQSATIQDGGDDKDTSRYTRLFAYDVSQASTARPTLKAEYIVPLPQSSKGKTLSASEIAFVSANTFLALSRDSDGHGGDDNNSGYKGIDLIYTSGATNIAGSKFDNHTTAVSPDGKLDKSVTPATYLPFVNMINSTHLARFGLHNDDPADQTLIDAKWESLALASVGDSAYPHDYFLFTAADNDFITTHGISLGKSYNAGLDNDNQFLVFRVTLPTK